VRPGVIRSIDRLWPVAGKPRNYNMEMSLADQERAITILPADDPTHREGPAADPVPARRPPSANRRNGSDQSRPAKPRKATTNVRNIASDDFYRDLVWSLRNGVIAVTVDGRVAVINDVAYRILGVPPRHEDIGRPFSTVLQSQPEVARIIAGAFELSHLPNRAELRLKSTKKVIGYTISQIQDARGRVTGAALFFKDLTRVEQLEERERLRDRLAALGEMAAAIAHEVKNPLAGIEVMAGILKRQLPESKDAQTILGDIIKEAKMANAIVLEVLEFVRPIRLQVEHMSLVDVIRDAIALAESHAPRGNVKVDVSLPAAVATIQGDPHQLRQLFTNLVINAFEALNGRGAVRIDATVLPEDDPPVGGDTLGPMVQVDVVDDGPGVPADVVDKVFSPFFTTKPQGTGLGLAIVRKIVNAHDGRIDMNAPAGGGTQFRVTLPVSNNYELFR
jgi:signal transduction histidine kinase